LNYLVYGFKFDSRNGFSMAKDQGAFVAKKKRITRLKVVIKEASDQELGLWLFELGT
jgi:hypothetical protein